MTKQTKINQSDLKIYPSERLTDNDDGGGMPTTPALTGEANELFDPISSIARVSGGFWARLVYAGVLRDDDETLHGSFLTITKPPADPTVSYLLVKAHKFGEMRQAGIKRIESFSHASIESKMTLLSTQPAGSKIIQAYQRVGETLPQVGDVYCLRQDKKGYPQAEQYVQVAKVDSEIRKFHSPRNQKDFERVVVKMQLTQTLETDFLGADYPSEDYIDNPCKIRETSVVDAGAYYGIKPVTTAINKNVQTIHVPNLMEKIIPTNQIETPLVDLSVSAQSTALVSKGNGLSVGYHKHHYAGRITHAYTGNAIAHASVRWQVSGQADIHDKPTGNGAGTLYQKDKAVGVVDYASGSLTLTSTDNIYNLGEISFRPAGKLSNVSDSLLVPITINNRGTSHVFNLPKSLSLGSLVAYFRSNGRFYKLIDDGTGVLKGVSDAFGSGSFNQKTGSLTLSLGELPDVGSGILLTWASTATTFDRKDETPKALMILPLSHTANPSSISLSWGSKKTARTSASGEITGDWVGRYNIQKNRLEIDLSKSPNNNHLHPKGAMDVTIAYHHGDKTHQSHKAPLRSSDGQVTLNLEDSTGAITPGSVKLRFNLLIENYDVETEKIPVFVDPYKTLTDDGKGGLVDETGKSFGSIDYANKRLTFLPDTQVNIPKSTYEWVNVDQGLRKRLFAGFEYVPAGASMPIDESALVEVWFYDENPKNSITETVASGHYEIDLLPTFAESITAGSLNFIWQNQHFYDDNGAVMMGLDPTTGKSVAVGTIDYQHGIAQISQVQTHSTNPVVINSLISAIDVMPITQAAFITPQAPLRPQSLQIRATTIDGKNILGQANAKGEIKGEMMQGVVDYEYGVVDVKFGKWVPIDKAANAKAENRQELSQAETKDGKVWQDAPVLGQSVRYNAVSYNYLPVDSTNIKIDSVRLPQDGRVPIFRRGDIILISNSQTDELGSAFTGGQTINLSRTDVDRICLKDATGKAVDATLWDYDLKAGTITLTPSIDLSGYQMPLSVKHTIQERNRLLSADIDGTLSLLFATKRDYPIDDTYVSSVLLLGDLATRASVPFTQRNWDNVWRDEPNGSQLLNRLNVKNYPIRLTDDGAITEKWLIKFTSSNQFELYGQALGFVKKADTLTDLAPINPATQKPYFTIDKRAFGADAPWASQDVIRFNTWGTLMPVWVLCAVQPTSNPLQEKDGFSMCLFGDTTEV